MSATVARLAPPPPAGELRPVRPPSCERLRLAGGPLVVLAERRTVPLVHLRCALPAGARYDPPGLAGLASLALPLLREGTVGRSADRIAAEAESRGADVLARVDWDAGFLVVELLAEDADFGLELLADLVTNPTFPEPTVESARHRQLTRLRQRRFRPVDLADAWFARAVYGGTAYGRSLAGTEESLGRIGREDLVAFHRRHHGLAGAVLVVVGSFRAADLARRLEALARPTAGEALPEPPALAPPSLSGVRIHLVDLPGAAQTELRLGHAGVPKHHPDFARLRLLVGILERQLHRELRERLGSAYRVSSRLLARRSPGPFVTATGVGHDAAGAAVGAIIAAMARLRREPVTVAELEEARDQALGSLLRSFEGYGLAAHLQQMAVENLPDDHVQRMGEETRGTTAVELAEIAGRHLHPERLAVVAVGPADRLRPHLAGWGEVTEVDPAVEPV